MEQELCFLQNIEIHHHRFGTINIKIVKIITHPDYDKIWFKIIIIYTKSRKSKNNYKYIDEIAQKHICIDISVDSRA